MGPPAAEHRRDGTSHPNKTQHTQKSQRRHDKTRDERPGGQKRKFSECLSSSETSKRRHNVPAASSARTDGIHTYTQSPWFESIYVRRQTNKSPGANQSTLGMVPFVLVPNRPLARARSTSAAAARDSRISSSCSAICRFSCIVRSSITILNFGIDVNRYDGAGGGRLGTVENDNRRSLCELWC